jgi:polar amino acid transport system permease protein
LIDLSGLHDALGLLSLSPPGWGSNLLRGLLNSLQIAFGAFGMGLVIGLFGAFGKLYGGPITRDLLAIYTTVIRAVPELVLILILYYVGTDLINKAAQALGHGRVEISGVIAGIWVLGVVQGAYATEVLRGAIKAVPKGQIEAARAFGMPTLTLIRRVTIPAMMSFATPGLANLWLIATKDTALLAIVGFNELTLETRQAASSTRAYFTFFLAAGALYLMVTLVSGVFFGRIEKWARRGQPSLRSGAR